MKHPTKKITIEVELEVRGNAGDTIAEEVIRKAVVKAGDSGREDQGILRVGSVRKVAT